MKIQDLLPQYLYQQKKLTLPTIGTFELNSAINVYELKEEGWPDNTITFSADRNALLSDELLAYIVQHTGKMKPLAISDLESHLSNGMQMLNIGKPFPFYQGSNMALENDSTAQPSDAANAIIKEAMRDDTKLPLYIVCGAGLTDLASAFLMEPKIASRLTLIWIGGP